VIKAQFRGTAVAVKRVLPASAKRSSVFDLVICMPHWARASCALDQILLPTTSLLCGIACARLSY
jgi:hypothetical protein